MVDSKHQWKAWIYLLPAIILLLIFTVWPIINTVVTSFIYNEEYRVANIQVEKIGDEEKYRFYCLEGKTQKYLHAKEDGSGNVKLVYAGESDTVFTFDSEMGAWTTVVGDKKYFMGASTDSDMSLIEATDDNVNKIESSYYVARLHLEDTANHVSKYAEENLVSDSKLMYRFELFRGIPEALRYVIDTSEDGMLNTTEDFAEATSLRSKMFPGEKSGEFCYQLYIKSKEGNSYIDVSAGDDNDASITYADATETKFAYDKTNKAWVCTVDGVGYYLALSNQSNHLDVHPVADIGAEGAPDPAVMYLHRDAVDEIQVAKLPLMDGNSYRIGAYREASGYKTYMTASESDLGGLKLTNDILGEKVSKVGFNNFVEVLTNEGSDFIVCLKNTLILTIITVPISTVLALLIAVALNSIKALQKLLQTIFFLPYVTNSIAIGMVFAAMFNIVGLGYGNESVGIINNILGVFGVERINWINQGAPAWASFTALIVYIVWNALPFKILILLGGLQSINKQYYDAAKIDGTPKWRVLTRITVPLLSPMLTYTVITSFIGGFKEYSSVVGIFGEEKAVAGGANMNTIVGHIQNHLTETRDYGLAGAAALMLFAIIFVVTMINLQISKKNTHY